MPVGDPQDNVNTHPRRERVHTLIQHWHGINNQLDRLRIEEKNAPTPERRRALRAQIAELDDERQHAAHRVREIVGNHPGLKGYAENHGFNNWGDNPPGAGGGGQGPTPQASGAEKVPHSGQGSTTTHKTPKTPKTAPTSPDHHHRHAPSSDGLPGVRGKDYVLRQHGDTVWAVYRTHLNGRHYNFGIKIPRGQFGKYNIDPQQVPNIARKQVKHIDSLGLADDVLIGGDKRHPFNQYLHKLELKYGGTGALKHPEVVATLLQGAIDGWDAQTMANQLKNTKWYSKKNQWERQWITQLKHGDRKAQTNTVLSKMKQSLQEMYGTVGWQKDWKDKHLKHMAEKIASGKTAIGDPTQALAAWANHATHVARKTEGTQAWADWQNQKQTINAQKNKPEEMFGQLRSEAIQALGYAPGTDNEGDKMWLDQHTVQQWANRLASGAASQNDWEEYLRKQKARLYPFLEPDENWTDFISPYKSMAESMLGKGDIGYTDRLFRDMGATDPNGKHTGEAVSLSDFEQRLRQSDRYWRSDQGTQEMNSLGSFLDSMFKGTSTAGLSGSLNGLGQ